MLYMIFGHDREGSLSQRLAARPAHLERLHELQRQGRLLLAGPCPAVDSADAPQAGFSGSLIVAEFDSLAAARGWAEADPYLAAGVYARVDVRPFRRALPA